MLGSYCIVILSSPTLFITNPYAHELIESKDSYYFNLLIHLVHLYLCECIRMCGNAVFFACSIFCHFFAASNFSIKKTFLYYVVHRLFCSSLMSSINAIASAIAIHWIVSISRIVHKAYSYRYCGLSFMPMIESFHVDFCMYSVWPTMVLSF